MGSFSIWYWLIVLVIVMLVFGTRKLRNVGADLGGAVKGFKDGMKAGTRNARDRRRQAGQDGADPPRPSLAQGRVLDAESFFEEGVALLPSGTNAPTLAEHMARVERDYLTRALARCGKHMGNTALELGISRKNLWEKMRKLGMRGELVDDA